MCKLSLCTPRQGFRLHFIVNNLILTCTIRNQPSANVANVYKLRECTFAILWTRLAKNKRPHTVVLGGARLNPRTRPKNNKQAAILKPTSCKNVEHFTTMLFYFFAVHCQSASRPRLTFVYAKCWVFEEATGGAARAACCVVIQCTFSPYAALCTRASLAVWCAGLPTEKENPESPKPALIQLERGVIALRLLPACTACLVRPKLQADLSRRKGFYHSNSCSTVASCHGQLWCGVTVSLPEG